MASQYKSIEGIKYERDLLESAEAATARGRSLSKIDAANIWEQAMDGGRVTPTERRTVEYIMEHFRMNESGKAFFKAKLGGDGTGPRLTRKGTSYYKTINGISYDRKLLEDAESRAAAQGGFLRFEDALQLWGKANDGPGITATERRTLQYIGQQHRLEAEAQQFFERSLGFYAKPCLTDAAPIRALKDGAGFLKSLWNRVSGKRASEALQAEASSLQASPAQIEDSAPAAKRQRVVGPESTGQRFLGTQRAEPAAAGALRDVPSSASRAPLPNAPADGAARGAVHYSGSSGSMPFDEPLDNKRNNLHPEDNLRPELQQLLSEMSGGGNGPMLQLEFPAAPCQPQDAELAAQKAKAAEEVERILAARSAAEVLGHGSKEEQRREFKRLALLLHPDKGLVDRDNARAGLAMRLAMAALNRSRQGA